MARRKRGSANRLDSAAMAIGGSLGRLTARVDALQRQRAAVAEDLRNVIASAQDMLGDLGDNAAIARHAGRKAVRKAKSRARKGKRRLSAQGRANIIAAAKKRWAKYNAKKKKR